MPQKRKLLYLTGRSEFRVVMVFVRRSGEPAAQNGNHAAP